MDKINIGIIGYGIIGEVLARWISEHNPNCQLFISDPTKGYYDDVSNCNIFWL